MDRHELAHRVMGTLHNTQKIRIQRKSSPRLNKKVLYNDEEDDEIRHINLKIEKSSIHYNNMLEKLKQHSYNEKRKEYGYPCYEEMMYKDIPSNDESKLNNSLKQSKDFSSYIKKKHGLKDCEQVHRCL